MKVKWLIVLFTSFCLGSTSLVLGQNEQDVDPIVVQVGTERALLPLYLTPFFNEEAFFPDSYLKQLEQVLIFDLSHNGYSYLVKSNSHANHILAESYDNFGPLEDWKERNVLFVVKPHIEGNQLSALLLDVKEQKLRSAEPIPLSGDFSQDRRQIHRLADTIHRALFGVDGIASTRILYTVKVPSSDPKKWISEVWQADYDGGNRHQVTSGDAYCVTPTYIPPKPGYTTGGMMYVSYKIGQPKIYVASLKDGQGQRLTSLRGNQLMPAVSKQRDKVAFISDITGNPDLFLQPFSPESGATGKPQQIFSARQATQGSPTFSPDGTKIAFVSDKDGSPRIYVIDIPQAGTSLKSIKATLISKQNRENSAPCWSPDGTKIAYCARNQKERQIWMYDFTTKQETQLTQGPGNKENPSWAPNSLHLVFNSSDANSSELYLMNLNQPQTTQLDTGPGDKRFPSWEPRFK